MAAAASEAGLPPPGVTNANLFYRALFHIQRITMHDGVIPLIVSFRNRGREVPAGMSGATDRQIDLRVYKSRRLAEGAKG